MGVESRADGGAADGEGLQTGKALAEAGEVGIEHGDVAGELLTEGDGSGVLEMSAADLDDVGELFGLRVEGVTKNLSPQGSASRGRP